MATVAIITARGGSKRIPRKNVKAFMGKPMIAYAKRGRMFESFCCIYPCVPFLTFGLFARTEEFSVVADQVLGSCEKVLADIRENHHRRHSPLHSLSRRIGRWMSRAGANLTAFAEGGDMKARGLLFSVALAVVQIALAERVAPTDRICGVNRIQPRAEIIWTRPISRAGYTGWPTVMRRKNGELIVSYSGNREGHMCPYGREELIRSSDGGETWTQKPEIFHNSIIDDRDSGIVETADGNLVAAWFSSTSFRSAYPKAMAKLPKELVDAARGYWTRRSTDDGRTWEAPVPHRGSAPHGAIRLRDGRLLFVGTACNHEDIWNPAHYPEGKSCMMVEESRDDGRSWQVLAQYVPQKPYAAWEDVVEPCPVETADGRILVFCRSENSPEMTQVESADGGRTWEDMSKTPLRGSVPHFLTLADGKILCSYVNRETRHEMAVVSEDQGRTWDVENNIFLSKGPKTDMGYPSTVENDDGTLLTVYYQSMSRKEKPCLMATKWRLK